MCMRFNAVAMRLLLSALVLTMIVTAGAAWGVASAQSTSSCIVFAYNMRSGSSDYYTGGSVTQLQQFLAGRGYFNSAYLGTGHFGPVTLRSVIQFQAANGVPSTGFVGPLTRAAIQQITCGTNPTPTSAVSLYSVWPTAGAVGTTVTLTGYGFTSSNTILMDGNIAAQNVPVTSSIAIACSTDPNCRGGIRQTIVFTVPSYLSPNCPAGSMCPMYMRQVTPGQYGIVVQNTNGTSNSILFTVTSGSGTGSQISITGLDAPASLSLGQSGTWSVHVASGSGSGNLHYSVVWGDEGMYYNGSMMPASYAVQSSATFTHAYQGAGTYTPVFTVTDDYGHSATVSNTVTITPLY